MQRKQFILSSLLAAPALAMGNISKINTPPFSGTEPFIVGDGKSRFGDVVKFLGVHPNDLKISSKDTWIQLTDKGKMIYMLQPAGKMEEFFIYMNSLKERPSPEEMDRIHAAHQMKVMGPPLTL